MNLTNIEPKDVFTYFEKLTTIPRESGREREVSDYLMEFAKSKGLETIQEPCMNVIIKKPAAPGYEGAPTVILQGHMDMVCVKEDDLDFDFDTMPLPIFVEGDWVKTKGTTLGADNGIAVAMALALLADKDAQHPALEVLITVEEETGMDGAMHLDPNHLSGQILINIDSDNEGVATVSCAGGVNHMLELPLEFKKVPDGMVAYEAVISGLKGGHSGVEIGEGRANSNKLLGRFLHGADQMGARLATLSGGEKNNAISKRASAVLLVEPSKADGLKAWAAKFEATLAAEFFVTDPLIKISLAEVKTPKEMLKKGSAKNAIAILQLVPFGPQTMSASIAGLVESSSNPGILVQKGNILELTNAVRSSVGSLKEAINQQLKTIADLTGAKSTLISNYPEWQYSPESKIRELMKDIYQETTGEELKVEAIHAGLECGFLGEKLGDIDMVSIGPNMRDIHTPKERLSISSTERTYQFIKNVLKALK